MAMTIHENDEEKRTCKRKVFAKSLFGAVNEEGSPRRGLSHNKQCKSWGCVLHFAPARVCLSTANKVVEHGQVLAADDPDQSWANIDGRNYVIEEVGYRSRCHLRGGQLHIPKTQVENLL